MRLLQWNIGPSRTPSSYAFERVVIPLEDAHLHSYSARMGTGSPDLQGARDGDADADADDADDSGKDVEHEETGMLEMSVSEYSVEGLRREVRKGTRGIPSEYERESILCRFSSRKSTCDFFSGARGGGLPSLKYFRRDEPHTDEKVSSFQGGEQGNPGYRYGPV